jgi:hypothetical protein
MDKAFQLPIIIEKVESLADSGWRMKLLTRELAPEEIGLLGSLKGQEIQAAFKESTIAPDDIRTSDERVEKGQKSPSQRLRGVLFVRYGQIKRTVDFDTWYKQQIEVFINAVKEKLD